jgi:hypothetical protein
MHPHLLYGKIAVTYSRFLEGFMRNVCFRLSDEEYNFLKENFPCTVPAYFAIVAKGIIAKIKDEQGSTEGEPVGKADFLEVDYDDEYQNNILRTCLTDSQKTALEAAAKKHEWSISREIRFRIQTTLSNKLDFYDNELFAFRQAKNDINKLGINLHFILQKDEGKILDKEGFKQDVTRLQNEIAELKKSLEKYIALGRGRQKQNAIGG